MAEHMSEQMSEKTTDPFGRIADYYERLIRQYGHDPRACDYGRPESQKIKFRVLSEVMPLSRCSLLDVGCGFADFAAYLQQHFSGVSYSGIDLCASMVAEARRNHPDLDLRTSNVLDATFDRHFDAVTANGTFYLLGEEAWPTMRKMIERMFGLATTALAFNSLSDWTNDREANEFYADPVRVLKFCRELTPWVVLRHDYHPRDFTVYMYKTPRT
jgi:cyclopropane fatty-acyl-phospholipid synthase-like methyltransferase